MRCATLKKRLHRLWWCLPVAIFAGVDGVLTLCGQSESYWSEGYSHINELNPLAAWLLSVHPVAFTLSGIPYLVLVALAVLVLPRRWALALVIMFTLTHIVGVISWCKVIFSPPLFVLVGLVLLGVVAFWILRKKWAFAINNVS